MCETWTSDVKAKENKSKWHIDVCNEEALLHNEEERAIGVAGKVKFMAFGYNTVLKKWCCKPGRQHKTPGQEEEAETTRAFCRDHIMIYSIAAKGTGIACLWHDCYIRKCLDTGPDTPLVYPTPKHKIITSHNIYMPHPPVTAFRAPSTASSSVSTRSLSVRFSSRSFARRPQTADCAPPSQFSQPHVRISTLFGRDLLYALPRCRGWGFRPLGVVS